MKKYGVLFLAALSILGFLFLQEKGKPVEAVTSSSDFRVRSSPQSFKEQASTAPVSSVQPVPKNFSSPAFFHDEGPRGRSGTPRRKLNSTALPTALPQGPARTRNTAIWPDQRWQVWEGVRAVPLASLQTQDIGSAKILGQLGGYVLVEDSTARSNEHAFSTSAPLALYNVSRNRAGLISGVFAVVLAEAQDFHSFVIDYDLKITGAFPQLRTYYVMMNKEPYDLVAALEGLRKDPRVEKVDLEVVGQAYGKK